MAQKSLDINQWLQQKYFEKETLIRLFHIFSAQQPFPHLVLQHFLQHNQAELLRDALLQKTFTTKESDLFSLHQTGDLHGSKNHAILGFIQFFESPAFHAFLNKITGMTFASRIDVSGSAYAPTNYLLAHNDLVEKRALAFNYYLTPNFTENDGGELQLFSTHNQIPQHIAQSYPAAFNTLIIFAVSADSFHQVAEVVGDKERLALSGWFHEKN
ncbi:MAG: 2OG-Fe(II) oxygenase family protein [Nanoarchaeota archaeon]